jgi:acyl-coenzyme A thioesterase PaaI-like protein
MDGGVIDGAGEVEHPGLAGRSQELGALVSAVRRLIALSVTTTAGPEILTEVTAGLEKMAGVLAAQVPEIRFPRFLGRDPAVPADSDEIKEAMPFDVVVGRYNPLALPVALEVDPPKAIGRAMFTTPYEGAPGCVHGASIAGAFDIVLTAANMLAGAAGPTVRLALRFRRPTLLGVESVFEAEVTSRSARRIHTEGQLTQGGQVTVEAQGEFATLGMEEIAALHKR